MIKATMNNENTLLTLIVLSLDLWFTFDESTQLKLPFLLLFEIVRNFLVSLIKKKIWKMFLNFLVFLKFSVFLKFPVFLKFSMFLKLLENVHSFLKPCSFEIQSILLNNTNEQINTKSMVLKFETG